jgi:signal transduction histidine kinase
VRWEWHSDKTGKTYDLIDTPISNPDGTTSKLEIFRDITDRKLAEEKLRSLASDLSLTEEKERRRIAAELHDNVGQTLAMIKIKLEELRRKAESDPHAERLDGILNLCKKVVEDTRSLTFELSPPVLYELGFEPAVAWLVDRHVEQHKIRVRFEDDGQPKPIDDDIRVLLFQSVRELLNNVARHSWAKEAKVSVEREDANIRIVVEDDGIGFDSSQLKQTGGFGLFNIHERLDNVGGRFAVRSASGEGTRVILMAPLTETEIQ